MSLHIHRFVDLVRATESRGQTSVIMSLQAAKDLHADITKLLVTLQQQQQSAQSAAQPIEIEVTGGGFKNT
jgi:hypothetical protein